MNGEKASEAYVVDFVERHRAFFEPLHPSFFELTTAMAFQYFKEQAVDIAVIEVGLGGRLIVPTSSRRCSALLPISASTIPSSSRKPSVEKV